MQQIFLMILTIVIISTVVGAVAKMLNNLAEANANRARERERTERAARTERNAERARAAQDERAERPAPRPARPAGGEHTGGGVRQTNSDMDRFLAEIDRLRRKQPVEQPPPAPGSAAPVAPVVQPVKPAADRPRPRVVAELADASAASSAAAGFSTSPQAPTRTAPVAGQIEELPVAQVLKPTSSTGAPATKVTKFSNRPRPAAKTNFGRNLTSLLGSGQGVAMAVVLQEILGPPKAKKNAAAHKQS